MSDWSHELPVLTLKFIFFSEDDDLFVTTSKSKEKAEGELEQFGMHLPWAILGIRRT